MKNTFLIVTVLTLLLSGCTLPFLNGASPEELAMTIVAQTQTAEAAALTGTPLPPTDTPEPEITSSPSVTTVSVSVATNCRTGPDVLYPLVLVFQPGAFAEVVGKYPSPVYWIIKTPTNETCWLWGEYATIQGNISTLPDMAAPPAPVVPTEVSGGGGEAGTGISAPGNFSAAATCQILDMGGGGKILQSKMDKLTWTSVNGATGYKIYVDGGEFQIVGGNATSFNINALSVKPSNYGIAAFDNETTSTVITIPEPNCP